MVSLGWWRDLNAERASPRLDVVDPDDAAQGLDASRRTDKARPLTCQAGWGYRGCRNSHLISIDLLCNSRPAGMAPHAIGQVGPK